MKRSAFKRKKPMKPRTTWMPRKRATPRRSSRTRDLGHLAAVHALPCWLWITDKRHRCNGPMEADHAGRRPAGRKCDDVQAIPLCRRAHRQRTDWSGMFRTWPKERMQQWLADGISWTQARLIAPGGS